MKLEMLLVLLLMVMMIGTFASTAVAVGLWVTLHIVVAGSGGNVGGVEGSTRTAPSGPIANHRCHNVQLPDSSRRLLIVYRANAADDRGRDLCFGITFCSYDCTLLLMLLLWLVLMLLLLLTVTLIITGTAARANLGPGDQIPSLLLLVVLLSFRGILLAGGGVASCCCRWWCTCCRSRRTAAGADG